jgi:FKBP-type peptidyl-prolyl cis-trans isomerase FklB
MFNVKKTEMKKISIFLSVGLALMFSLSSCQNQKTVSLKTQLDSLNYAFGVLNGPQVKAYSLQGDTSTKAVEAFIKGFEKGMGSDDKHLAQYATGLNIGAALKKQAKAGLLGDSSLTMNLELIKAGLFAAMKEKGIQMKPEVAEAFFRATMQKYQRAKMKKQYGANLEAGQKFLAENKTKPGVKTLPDGLQYQVLKEGKGPMPKGTDNVQVNYKGSLIDGTVFDSNEGKAPVTFQVDQVIKGWTEALEMMPVGSKWRIFVPADLAYQDQDRGAIKPFSTLIFDIELVGIAKPTTAAPAGQQPAAH